MSEIYLLMVIHFKCVAVLFGLSPEGKYNTVSSYMFSTLKNPAVKKGLPMHLKCAVDLEYIVNFNITSQ